MPVISMKIILLVVNLKDLRFFSRQKLVILVVLSQIRYYIAAISIEAKY